MVVYKLQVPGSSRAEPTFYTTSTSKCSVCPCLSATQAPSKQDLPKQPSVDNSLEQHFSNCE